MDTLVDVTIPVETTVAAALRDERTRVPQRQRRETLDRLFTVMDQVGTEAEAKGLTETILGDELEAYNAARRG